MSHTARIVRITQARDAAVIMGKKQKGIMLFVVLLLDESDKRRAQARAGTLAADSARS